MDILFSKTMNQLSGMLDYRSKRHKIIISNIANLDTEGFKPSDITFKQALGKANSLPLATTNQSHFGRTDGQTGPVEVVTSEGNVKLDTEMANLAENQLMYNITVDMLSKKFTGLNTVLKETK